MRTSVRGDRTRERDVTEVVGDVESRMALISDWAECINTLQEAAHLYLFSANEEESHDMKRQEARRPSTGSPTTKTDDIDAVSREALLPVVIKHFEKLSAVQWNLLAAGIPDSETTAALVDLCTEVIQIIAVITLNAIKPSIQESFYRKEPEDGTSPTVDKLNIRVGDVLSDSFAAVLNIKQEKCESAQQLTDLIETEVLQKVNSVVSEAVNSPAWPSDPAVLVSGSVSDLSSLRQMVSRVTDCLTRCLDKLRYQCLGDCWQLRTSESTSARISVSPSGMFQIEEPECCDSPLTVKSKISVLSATKAVSEIITKWSRDSADMAAEGEGSRLSEASLDATEVAADIVKAIIDDLHESPQCAEESGHKSISPKPHFNVRSILTKVKEFFASQSRTSAGSPSDDNERQKSKFSSFAQKEYLKMVAELKSKFRRQDAQFLVSLRPPLSLRLRLSQNECDIPGAVPETPRNTPDMARPPSRVSRTSMTPTMSEQNTTDVKAEMETLYDRLNRPQTPPAHIKMALDNIKARGFMDEFSKELAEKIYDLLMTGPTYQVPVVSEGKYLSDSVITKSDRRVAGIPQLSPEVLYAMTEDVVEKFLQKLLIWMDGQTTEKTNYSEQVSGALTDIQDLITDMLSRAEEEEGIQPMEVDTIQPMEVDAIQSEEEGIQSEEEDIVQPQSPEDKKSTGCCSQTACFSGSSQAQPKEQIHIAVYVTSRESIISNMELRRSLDDWNDGCPPSVLYADAESAPYVEPPEFTENTHSVPEEKTNNLISALLLRLLTKNPNRADQSQEAFVNSALIKLLQDLAEEDLNTRASMFRKNKDMMAQLKEAMTRDFFKEFGSPENLLKAATASDDSSYDDAIVKYLQVHLNAILSQTKKKKSRVARFFSAVRKTLTRPFRSCFQGN